MKKITLGTVLVLIALTLYSLVDIITSSGGEKEPVHTSEAKEATTETASETVAEKAVTSQKTAPEPVLSVQEKKRRFIKTILPAVRKVKQELDDEYAKVKQLASKKRRSPEEDAWLEATMAKYNVDGIPCLLRRMHTHPVSLVMAQAALETGWGSSRFFHEANNIFGIWSYHKNEPRIPAAQARGKKAVFVKKYASLDDGIRGYFKMISSGYAYNTFRKARMQTDNPFELLRYLRHYSELRDEYIARLYYVMKANKLYTYDDPSYRPIALSHIIPEYIAQKREAAERKKEQDQQLLALDEVKVCEIPEEGKPAVPCEEEEAEAEQNSTLQTPMSANP